MDRGSRSLHRMHKWQPEAPAHVRYCMVAASRRWGRVPSMVKLYIPPPITRKSRVSAAVRVTVGMDEPRGEKMRVCEERKRGTERML